MNKYATAYVSGWQKVAADGGGLPDVTPGQYNPAAGAAGAAGMGTIGGAYGYGLGSLIHGMHLNDLSLAQNHERLQQWAEKSNVPLNRFGYYMRPSFEKLYPSASPDRISELMRAPNVTAAEAERIAARSGSLGKILGLGGVALGGLAGWKSFSHLPHESK